MCGIWALFGYDHSVSSELHQAVQISHRGPEFMRIETIPHFNHSFLAFHRLSIIDDLNGQQPLRLYTLPHLYLMYNGEIYNHKELVEKYGFERTTQMDGEVILHMYNKFGIERTLQELDGVFAVTILDTKKQQFHLGRDTFGVRPMFTVRKQTGELGVCSEAKGLIGLCRTNGVISKVEAFVPGHYATFQLDPLTGKTKLVEEKRFTDVDIPQKFDIPVALTDDVEENIRSLLTDAVRKRLMSDRRIGCMLSGGLDSSLIASLVVKLARESGVTYPIQTFSIGLPESPDLVNAKKVADMLGTEHHEVIFSPDEAFAALKDINYSLETYDITTNRASIPMWILSKYIKENTDTTVVFSGEGSDELTQGYIYFHKAPNEEEAHEESKRLLRDLYLYDNLRADRSTAAFGLELRVPFLDKAFTSYYLSLPKKDVQPTNGIEKYLLRNSFAGKLTEFLPDEVLWRAKEAFSDGVSKKDDSWSCQLERYARSVLNENELTAAAKMYPYNTPTTYESLFYRKTFESKFQGQSHLIPYMWLPKWLGNVTDPSARVLEHYKS